MWMENNLQLAELYQLEQCKLHGLFQRLSDISFKKFGEPSGTIKVWKLSSRWTAGGASTSRGKEVTDAYIEVGCSAAATKSLSKDGISIAVTQNSKEKKNVERH